MLKKALLSLAVALTMTIAFLPVPADARQDRTAKLRVWYRGTRPHVRCFLNGRASGRINRNQFKYFTVARGRSHTVRLSYPGRSRTRSVYIARGQSSKMVSFFKP